MNPSPSENKTLSLQGIPMTNPSLGTADWLAQIQEEILELERSLLFKETARRFYRLD